MASRYDDLDAHTELEQRLASDLRAALEPRGCTIVHHGTGNGGRHSPGGLADIEVRDQPNRRLILVEVTRRKGSAADGEFPAITDHLNRAVAQGEYSDYGLLYISPATSARMSANFRDLYNRNRERDGIKGRIIGFDFATAELLLSKLSKSDPDLYPASALGDLLARWAEAIDDARTRQLIQQVIFPDDLLLATDLANEAQEIDAGRERDLKARLRKVEDELRHHGITGNNANTTLVYLAFLRLFEERRQRETGQPNRFTLDGFRTWRQALPMSYQRQHRRRLVEALIGEIAQDEALREAGLLQEDVKGSPRLHPRLTDDLVEGLILPVFDDYDFHAGRVDILGAVFETLARRSEKDTRIGQFFTPQQVVDFCADLVRLRPVDIVLDPAVGTGRFLIAAMERMLDNADMTMAPHRQVAASIRARQLIGTDIDGWVATIAKMNMFIHGDGKSGIVPTNGLVLGDRALWPSMPNGVAGEIDAVLTNPPLGDTDYTVAGTVWAELGAAVPSDRDLAKFYESLGVIPMRSSEAEEIARLEVQQAALERTIADLETMRVNDRPRGRLARALRRRSDLSQRIAGIRAAVAAGQETIRPAGRTMKGGALFVGAIANYLSPNRDPSERLEWTGGRATVVVDEALLNTPEYAPVREFIRRHFFIKAVVSLARDAFKYLAHTDAKTSVLYLIKKPSPTVLQREPIFFAHAERVGYGATGNWVGDDLPQILIHYQLFESCVKAHYRGRSFRPAECMAAIARLPNFGHAFFARLDSGEGQGRLDYFDARAEERRKELETAFGAVDRLGDVLEVRPAESPPPSRSGEYEFAYVSRLGVVRSKGRQTVSYRPSELWVVREGDVVVSGIDVVNFAIGVAGPDADGLVMSREMYPYRVRDGVAALPDFVQSLLRTAIGRELVMGLVTGTSNRTRLESAEQLLSMPIPRLPSLKEQRSLVEPLRQAHRLQREAEERLSEANSHAEAAWARPKPRARRDPRKLPTAEAELIG